MDNADIPVALIGAGYISEWHAAALKRTSGVHIAAICDVSENAARALADSLDVRQVLPSVDAIIASGAVRSAHVLTPPHTHEEIVAALIDGGIDVFVEKPMCLSAEACTRLEERARAKNVRLGVNHNFLMLPSYDRFKRDLDDKRLGPIDTLEVNWQFPLAPLRSGPFGLWMLREPKNLLFELGPHLFSFVADLFHDAQVTGVALRNPIETPAGVKHYQTWRVDCAAGATQITLNISLIEGCDNRSLTARALGGMARYDFAADTYRRETEPLGDIVIGPLIGQLAAAGQHMRNGAVNAFRQFSSLNELSPYGLSITRAVQSFYKPDVMDARLSPKLAARATALIEEAVEKAGSALTASSPATLTTALPDDAPTYLVIGGTGFIGRALTAELVRQGNRVGVFSRGRGAGTPLHGGAVQIVSGDLKSKSDLVAAMEDVAGVFHLARAEEATWQGYLDNDVAVTEGIGDACLEAGVGRLVYTGTIDSYDASNPDRPITEETPFDDDLEHRNLYARSKALCEARLIDLQTNKNLPLVIARPGIVIGEGGPLQHWGIAMWRGAVACKLWGAGDNPLPFVLVDDTARGLVATMTTPDIEGRSFNLVGDPMLSAKDYFSAIGEANRVAMRAKPTPIWTYYAVDLAKYYAKRYLAGKKDLTKPSYRDWKSRAQYSPYRNDAAKEALEWKPESNRDAFIRKGIVEARLFGLDFSDDAGADHNEADAAPGRAA